MSKDSNNCNYTALDIFKIDLNNAINTQRDAKVA
jgi:hypothetical protein